MNGILHDLRLDHLSGRRGGMVSICSARREVLEAAMELARPRGDSLLVEATANQVNQFGGYTGMTPAAFAAYLAEIASAMGFPRNRLLLGADHLGPSAWRQATSETAMRRSLELAGQCVSAGFHKIHIDTGFGCADDPGHRLPPQIAAERAVVLVRAAEAAADRRPPHAPRPLYVIGAEVPPPGGALEDPALLQPTPVGELQEIIRLYEERFRSARLQSAWERVLAVVVQPGVEFGDRGAAPYRPELGQALSDYHERLPGIMTYEIHSTDYQPAKCLARMIRDHFTLLKVGPCLTHAFRAAVFALARIESEWLAERRGLQPSNIREALEGAMLEDPVHWRSHYRGSDAELRFLRSHSKRDRIRYYWGHPAVAAAFRRLMANLGPSLPPELAQAHMGEVCGAEPCARGPADPAALIRRRIQLCLQPYVRACA
jgi:D-tagatose-1,6-bisphosphate aldolase subunit GatZ/KbaZ